MRELIIDCIRESKRWQGVIDIGESELLPILENLSSMELLEMYDFYVNGMVW